MHARHNRPGRDPSSRRRTLAMLASATALLTACGAPTAGMWQGTADIGPLDAFPLVVMMPDEGLEGEVEIKAGGEAQRHRICKARARNGHIELHIDWTHRDCKVPAGAKADPRVFRGVLGEGVLAGAIEQGEAKVGFFRAYRQAR